MEKATRKTNQEPKAAFSKRQWNRYWLNRFHTVNLYWGKRPRRK